MFVYLEAADLADRLGQNIDDWDAPTVARAQSIAEETVLFVSVLTNVEFTEDTPVPDRIRSAARSIAARHFLERVSDVTKERLGDWSQEYAAHGTFTADDLTSMERTLLSPWMSKNPGFGQINVTPGYTDTTRYVPVAGSPEPFPLITHED